MTAREAGPERGEAGKARDVDSAALADRVDAAAGVLAVAARRTPVFRSRSLDARTGAEVWLKAENLQNTGAFKFRGAFHALSRLDEAARRRGVITYSSGNHAQALARAGQLLGVSVTVVMPVNAPQVKRDATLAYGAEVIGYDPRTAVREELGGALATERGLTLIPPYDHPDVIAGQGTTALELLEQTGGLDLLLVPTGGGGLLSGCALACWRHAPACRVVGVEPELADDATRSYRTGVLHRVCDPPTIADGTRTPFLGERTFPLVRRHVADMVTVSEEAIAEATRFLMLRTKLVVEPSGALGVAALLAGALRPTGRVGVVLSGGNVDGATIARILSPQPEMFA